MKYLEDYTEIGIDIAGTIAALYFIGMQGYFCLRHPFEWFTTLISLIVLSACFLVHQREDKADKPCKEQG